MLEDYFEEEEEEEQQQQPASAEVAITKNGQQNQPNCSTVCVLLAAKERAQCACARCLVSRNITQIKFVMCHPLCEYCVS
jgi:hypothetical protein